MMCLCPQKRSSLPICVIWNDPTGVDRFACSGMSLKLSLRQRCLCLCPEAGVSQFQLIEDAWPRLPDCTRQPPALFMGSNILAILGTLSLRQQLEGWIKPPLGNCVSKQCPYVILGFIRRCNGRNVDELDMGERVIQLGQIIQVQVGAVFFPFNSGAGTSLVVLTLLFPFCCTV